MKKIIIIFGALLVVVIVVFDLYFLLGHSKDNWVYQNTELVKHGNPQVPPTPMPPMPPLND